MSATGSVATVGVSLFSSALAWLKTEEAKAVQVVENVATEVVSEVESDVAAAVPELLTALDTIVSTNLTAALGFVQAAATNPDLFNSGQKRSEVVANLTQHLEAQGVTIGQQGFQAAVNVLVETAVSIGKAVWPSLLGAAFGAL